MTISSTILLLSHTKGREMNLQETLKHYGIKSFWHFTDMSNLESIKKYGLLSLHQLNQKKVNVSCYGANELSHQLDEAKGLDRYVHLSFIPDHPMQYMRVKNGKMPNPIWLEIDVSVIFENRTLCSDEVANATDADLYHMKDMAKVIDLKTLLKQPHWSNPIRKAELMVANKIDYSKIKEIYHG